MPLVVKDRVRETTATLGTGTITLAGAVTGFQSFSAIGNANTTYYTINLPGANEWEVGIGTYTASGTTLSRDTVLASSNSNSLVNFSAGTKDVFCTYPAGRSVYYDTATNVSLVDLTTSGNTILGDASTDTVRVNGYMGVGAAPNSQVGIRITSSALTGANQYGLQAAFTGNSAATTSANGLYTAVATEAASFTCVNVRGFWAANGAVGAGSTVTNKHGVYIDDQTGATNNFGITSLVSSGSNKWNIYASGTAANYFAGLTTFNNGVGISGSSAPASGQSVEISYGAIAGTGRVMAYDRTGAARLPLVLDGQPVTLTHNNVTRVATSSTGVDVTGALTVSGNTTLGDASTDTVMVNGYMGVGGGGAANSTRGINVESAALTGTTQTGVYSAVSGNSSATSGIRGFTALPQTAAASFTVADVAGFWYAGIGKGAGSTITNAHGLYIGDQTQGTNNYGITSLVSSGTNKWNIYSSGTARNYMAGALSVGATTDPGTGGLYVAGNTTLGDASTDTVQVNGYMGVGGAVESTTGLKVTSAALTGSGQIGVWSDITATSAATTNAWAYRAHINLANAAFTCASAFNIRIVDATKIGGTATLTNQHGVYIDDLTAGTNNFGITSLVSSGTNKWNIYASGTAANYFAGNVGIGTSSPQAVLEVRGTSPIRASRDAQITLSGTGFGHYVFAARYDASNYIEGASIVAISNAAWSASSIPTYLSFRTGGTTSGSLVERLLLGNTATVFNDTGEDVDFRVESDTNTHALFVQGSDGFVGIGTNTPNYLLDVRNASGGATINVQASTGNAAFRAISLASGSAQLLLISFPGTQSIVGGVGSVNNMVFSVDSTERFRLSTTEAVFNDPGNDYDFRVESDTNTHALFVQGSDGNVGIGTSSPSNELEVYGTGSPRMAIRAPESISETPELGFQFGTGANSSANVLALLRAIPTQVDPSALKADLAFLTNAGDNATERLRITSAGNVSIGGNVDRATTVGTNALNIFDGTAPVGTLANGISLYSSSGEAYVMDAAGNATLFSPHDAETNEWIFKSKHTPSGKVLKIDVEKMLRFINDHFGLDAIHEFTEE